MGDILRDSNSMTAAINIDIGKKHNDIDLVEICSLNNSSCIDEDPISHEEFSEFIKIAKESKKYKLRISFNNIGYFW